MAKSKNQVNIEEGEEDLLEHALEKGANEGAPLQPTAAISCLIDAVGPLKEFTREEEVNEKEEQLNYKEKEERPTVGYEIHGWEI